jgi:hypothetical protein
MKKIPPAPPFEMVGKNGETTIKAWSFSRWKDWLKCPFMAGCKHLVGLKEPGNQYTARGNNVHEEAEHYVKGEAKELMEPLAHYKEELDHLRMVHKRSPRKIVLEEQWAWRDDWTPVDWFSPEAWLRVKMDVGYMVDKREWRLLDYKTGKYRKEDLTKPAGHYHQLELYGLAGLMRFGPAVKDIQITARVIFLDAKQVVEVPMEDGLGTMVWTMADLEDLQERWQQRVAPMLKDTRFPMKPNRGCGWCHYRKANGGPCKY